MWRSLEARHLNSFENLESFKGTYDYVFSYILDDMIIYYWFLNILNIRFNLFCSIRCFDQNFKNFINLKTLQLHVEREKKVMRDNGGDTSIPREASKEATKHYNLRRNARIWCHPYELNNMMILTKKFKNLSLEDIYIS